MQWWPFTENILLYLPRKKKRKTLAFIWLKILYKDFQVCTSFWYFHVIFENNFIHIQALEVSIFPTHLNPWAFPCHTLIHPTYNHKVREQNNLVNPVFVLCPFLLGWQRFLIKISLLQKKETIKNLDALTTYMMSCEQRFQCPWALTIASQA